MNWHRRTQSVLMVVIGLILLTFLVARLDWLRLPAGIFFPTVVLFILSCSVFWWVWGDCVIVRLWRVPERRGNEPDGSRPRGRPIWLRPLLRTGWFAHFALGLSPLAFGLAGARDTWDAMPPAVLAWVYVWHMLMVVVVSLVVIGWWVRLALRVVVALRMKTTHEAPSPPVADPASPTIGSESPWSRREILSASLTAAPLVIVGGSVARSVSRQGAFDINRMDLKLANLPDRLRGFTITHVSDFHVGRFFRPEHLPALVDATNALASDLVAITGDILDHDIDYLPDACDAIAQFEAPRGTWLVAGNHDLIDSPQEFLAEIDRRSSEFHSLHDRRVSLRIDGEEIQLAGLFWSRHDEPLGRDPGHRGRVESTLGDGDPDAPGGQPGPFTLALAHHPHAFDYLADRGVDLTLAGHTHGGQLMLPRRATAAPLGLGNLLFRYVHGTYWRGPSALFVNAGVGNWFPVRLNAPAEIVQIRLV